MRSSRSATPTSGPIDADPIDAHGRVARIGETVRIERIRESEPAPRIDPELEPIAAAAASATRTA